MRRQLSPTVDADVRGREKTSESDVVHVEITDVLDLHAFAPADVPDLVKDYLEEARARGYYEVRIIHGRGAGVQRRTVRAILSKHPRVIGFDDAPPQLGGWGATCVSLRD